MFESDPRRKLRVGLFSAVMITLLCVAILMIGGKQGLFVKKVSYHTRFQDVGGLTPGAPVWLNGVVVGQVDDVRLPADPAMREIVVDFNVEKRVARRIRLDSRARIRTLGLLGDRYLDVSSGSPGAELLQDGDEVASEEPRDVAEMLSQGGDVVTNVRAISASLRRILERIESGEGVLGELITDPETGRKALEKFTSVLDQTDLLLADLRAGKGALGRLIVDPELERQLVDDIAGFASAGRRASEALARDLARDDSVVASLLRDPQGRERIDRVLDDVAAAAAGAAQVSRQLNEGDGTLSRLLADGAYAGDFLGDLAALTRSLRSIAEKLDNGHGTAGQALNDPTLWRDLEDVVRGVRESKVLGWLIRNRREAGAEVREEEAGMAGRGSAADGR